VGTPEEAIVAMTLIHDAGEFEETLFMKEFIQNILPDKNTVNKLKHDILLSKSKHLIPPEFQSIISNITL